jgi:hypothetical protein
VASCLGALEQRRQPSCFSFSPPGTTGARNLTEFAERAEFIRISPASLRESHVHDVTITRESPNYPREG